MTSLANDGWLVLPALRRLTPNRYYRGFFAARIKPVELVVYHFTAGGFDGSLRWLTSRDSSVSAHFIVRKDGAVWQLAPLTDRTWHAGGNTSSWRGQGQVNNRSIGIEIENWGKLKPRRGLVVVSGAVPQEADVLTYKDTPFRGQVFVHSDGTLWDAYTEAQLLALEHLTAQLIERFPILMDPDRLVGHQDVDPTRKVDPGPNMSWSRIRAPARPVG